MVVTKFPEVETADRNGLVAIGGDLDPEALLPAYSSGIPDSVSLRRNAT